MLACVSPRSTHLRMTHLWVERWDPAGRPDTTVVSMWMVLITGHLINTFSTGFAHLSEEDCRRPFGDLPQAQGQVPCGVQGLEPGNWVCAAAPAL
jgi:hypothetical protein